MAPTPTTRADDRFERLEGAVGGIQTDLAELRGTFTSFCTEVRARFDQIEQLLQGALTSPFIVHPRSPSPPPPPPAEPANAPDAAEQDTELRHLRFLFFYTFVLFIFIFGLVHDSERTSSF